jgi:hypothetical protein
MDWIFNMPLKKNSGPNRVFKKKFTYLSMRRKGKATGRRDSSQTCYENYFPPGKWKGYIFVGRKIRVTGKICSTPAP